MSVAQLNGARQLIEQDPSQYPVLIRSVLPICDRPEVELRAWCAGFIADFFCAGEVDEQQKTQFALEVLDILKQWIEGVDAQVVKLAVCILCEVYPRIYQLAFVHGFQYAEAFGKLTDLKLAALGKWTDFQRESVCVACVKLTQVVILTNQQATTNHPVLDSVVLTAEATGLLDRLLAIFPTPVAGATVGLQTYGMLSASLNASIGLALSQSHLAGKIVSYILTFDLSKRSFASPAQQPLVLRWIGKLFKLALHPLSKMYPQIPKYLAGLSAYCTNQSLKRRAQEENVAKRPKLNDSDLPPGPQPYKSLYTLFDNSMTAFNSRDLQFDLAVTLAASGLERVDLDDLEERIAVIRRRIGRKQCEFQHEQDTGAAKEAEKGTGTSEKVVASAVETEKTKDTSEQKSQLSDIAKTEATDGDPAIATGPSRAALEVKVPDELKLYDFVFNKLLGHAPIRLVARLVARGLCSGSLVQEVSQKKLYAQLVPEFRTQLDSIVLWISEVYYAHEKRSEYFDLVGQVVEDVMPKLEVADSRIFVRLLSEIPELNRDIIFKIKPICLDPERSVIGFRSIKFLIMFKPPCRKDCLDLAKELVESGVKSLQPVLNKYMQQK